MRLLFNTKCGLKHMCLPIGAWTIEEALHKELLFLHTEYGLNRRVLSMGLEKSQSKQIEPILSMILFLCADKPDVDGERCPGSSPAHPKPNKVQRGLKLTAPQNPHVWVVGKKTEKDIEEANRFVDNMIKVHGIRTVSPHIRRAHWHGYWKGPRDGEREFILHWHPITIVGLSSITGNADNYDDGVNTTGKGA
jgi:hypothetical protein